MTSTITAPAPTSARTSLISAALGLFAGMFVANGLPHTYFGLMGTEHMSPFGTAASVNLVWGLANLAIGVALTTPQAARRASLPFTVGAAAGAMGLAASLIVLWS